MQLTPFLSYPTVHPMNCGIGSKRRPLPWPCLLALHCRCTARCRCPQRQLMGSAAASCRASCHGAAANDTMLLLRCCCQAAKLATALPPRCRPPPPLHYCGCPAAVACRRHPASTLPPLLPRCHCCRHTAAVIPVLLLPPCCCTATTAVAAAVDALPQQ